MAYEWDLKLDITSKYHGGRWLYDSKNGIVAKLNYSLTPKYSVFRNDKFLSIVKKNGDKNITDPLTH